MGKGEIIPVSDCSNLVENCVRCCLYCCLGSFYIGLGITKITIGALNLYSCSLQYLVPIYLIVSAVCPALFAVWSLQDSESGAMTNLAFVIALLGSVFNFVWHICGSVWVYSTYATIHSSSFTLCSSNLTNITEMGCVEKDCSELLLNFAFGTITFEWIILGIWAMFIAKRISNWLQKY